MSHVVETKEHEIHGQLCSICSDCYSEYAVVSRSNLCKVTFCALFWITIISLILVVLIRSTSIKGLRGGEEFTGKLEAK